MRSDRTIGLSTLILIIAGLTPLSATYAAESDEKAVKVAMDGFHAALQSLFEGDVDPMKEVWSHADDVTYMGPGGGIQVGWTQILSAWESQAALKLGGEVKFENMHLTVGRDLAVAGLQIVGEHVVGGKVQKVSIRATSVFRKENGKWKMIGHHTDSLPFIK